MDELVLELLANPPLTAEELGAPAAPVGPLSVAPCGRCLASVGVRSFVDADEIREASVLISCSGHPYLKALAGFGDDRGEWRTRASAGWCGPERSPRVRPERGRANCAPAHAHGRSKHVPCVRAYSSPFSPRRRHQPGV